MKAFTTIFLLGAAIFVKSTSSAADVLATSPSPLELVMNCGESGYTTNLPDRFMGSAEFGNADNSSTNIAMQVTFRNVSENLVFMPDTLIPNLSIVWDGKEYKQPVRYYAWSEIPLKPKSCMYHYFYLSDFVIPPEVRTYGRHTIAVRERSVESSTLTIFIEKQD
ncbi:MAG TPA: hypothetical protein VIK35_04860 [Verrucomicrobiae bacterium]